MPSERFYKLPQEKQDRIHQAAMKEFSSAPMEDISINRIVKEAGISRGSFYTYFEDKDDVLLYLIQEMQEKQNAYLKHCVEEMNGDLWKIAYRLLDYGMKQSAELHLFEPNQNYALRSGFHPVNMIRMKENGKGGSHFCKQQMQEWFEWLMRHLNLDEFRDKSEATMRALIIQLHVLVLVTIAKSFLEPECKEEAMEQFERMLDLLKYGALK